MSQAGNLDRGDKMIQRKLPILLAAIAFFSSFTVVLAQSASVAISPASIDAKVKRGSSYTQFFTLTNSSNTRLRFKCSLGDVSYDENNKRIEARAGTTPRSASLWIEFLPAEVIVEPHSSGIVKALVTVPSSAAGSYYSAPVFEALPADMANATPGVALITVSTAKATIGLRFSGLMMFTTLDAAEYNIEIMVGKITPPTASSELALQLDIRNRGNAHARVRGSFALLNSSGVLAGRGTIKDMRYMPDQRKMLETGWAGDLAPGTYTTVITLSYDRVGMEPATLLYELPLVVQ
jgi:hypothetical protein